MKIKNETLKKLTNDEANDLGLVNIGCMFVRGNAKQRVKTYTTTFKSDDEMHYTRDDARVELIKLDSASDRMGEVLQDWCVRVFNEFTGEYDVNVQPLFALNFIK